MLAVARTASFPVLMPEEAGRERLRRRRRGRVSPLGRAVAVVLLAALPAIAYVAQSTAAARTGYAILRLRQEVAQLEAEHARLVAAVSALRSPERIERAARTQLGMGRPEPGRLAALTVPAPALPAAAAPTLWQRMAALLLGREAEARER